jgi:hypothetical protein
MTTETRYSQLTPAEQKRVNREVSEIKRFGRNAFWMETGSHADDPRNYWSVVEFAMAGLGL